MRLLLRRLAAAFFFRLTVGDSKCCLRLISDRMPSCCTRLLNLLRRLSKVSPSPSRTSDNLGPLRLSLVRLATPGPFQRYYKGTSQGCQPSLLGSGSGAAPSQYPSPLPAQGLDLKRYPTFRMVSMNEWLASSILERNRRMCTSTVLVPPR